MVGGMDAGQVRVPVKGRWHGVMGTVCGVAGERTGTARVMTSMARGAALALALALCASCVKSDRTGSDAEAVQDGIVAVSGDAAPAVVEAVGLVDASFELTQALVTQARAVLVVDASLPELVEVAEAAGTELAVPVLFVDPATDADRLVGELDRLGAETVVTLGEVGETPGNTQVVLPVAGGVPDEVRDAISDVAPGAVRSGDTESESDNGASSEQDGDAAEPDAGNDASESGGASTGSDVTVLVGESWEHDVLLGTVRAVRAAVVPDVTAGDPRVQDSTITALRDGDNDAVVALGAEFGDADVLASRVATARDAALLPGGGQVLFPYRQMVALYGSPGTPSLGLLGEQDVEGAVVRAKEYAQQYQELNDKPVVPAFEIITTVASAGAGSDGDYSEPVAQEVIRPWIERAQAEDIYVVLDLQPGTTDFLTQAKMFEDLLAYPNVGLALDPEWRLKPGQRHLRQIGSVGIDEVNSVHEWLTQVVADRGLPQKLLVLHQFKSSMLDGRERVALSNDEVSVLIHVDGNGPPGAKQATWERMRDGAPDVFWGWKNFIDEDAPMLTPAQTMQVQPIPDLVTYQ